MVRLVSRGDGVRRGWGRERIALFYVVAGLGPCPGPPVAWGQESPEIHITETIVSTSVRPYVRSPYDLEMAASENLESVLVWNGERPMFNMSPIPLAPGFSRELGTHAFSPDGTAVLFTVRYGAVVAVHLIRGNTLSAPMGPVEQVVDLSFSEDGNSCQVVGKVGDQSVVWVNGERRSAPDSAFAERSPPEMTAEQSGRAKGWIESKPYTPPPTPPRPGMLAPILFGNETDWSVVVDGEVRQTWRSGGPILYGARRDGLSHLCLSDSGRRWALLKSSGGRSTIEGCGYEELWPVTHFVKGGEPRFVSEDDVQFIALKAGDESEPTPVYRVSIHFPGAGKDAVAARPEVPAPAVDVPPGARPEPSRAEAAAVPVPERSSEAKIVITSPPRNATLPANAASVGLRFRVEGGSGPGSPEFEVIGRTPAGAWEKVVGGTMVVMPTKEPGPYRITVSAPGLQPASVAFRKASGGFPGGGAFGVLLLAGAAGAIWWFRARG